MTMETETSDWWGDTLSKSWDDPLSKSCHDALSKFRHDALSKSCDDTVSESCDDTVSETCDDTVFEYWDDTPTWNNGMPSPPRTAEEEKTMNDWEEWYRKRPVANVESGEAPKTVDTADSYWICEGLETDNPHRAIACSFMEKMANTTTILVEEDSEQDSRGIFRDDRNYPKIFMGDPLPELPNGISWREYPVFQQGHPTYLDELRPSGPGPVRVHIPWDSEKRERAKHVKPPYQVSYHDQRRGDDHWRNVELAVRISKSEARDSQDPQALSKFREGFRKTFSQCREALESHKAKYPEKYDAKRRHW